MIPILMLMTQLLGPLSPVPQDAESSYVNPQMCPSNLSYLPTPMLFCRLPGGEKWHEQGGICHDDPAERGSPACECHLEDVPDKRMVTFCKAPKGF